MNPDSFLPFALATMIGANLIRVAWELVGASRYELSAVKQQRQARQQPHSRRLRHRPLLTVILTTHNDQATILGCLAALAKSSYRKRQIIIIDHASIDNTRRSIKSYIDVNPKQNIRLVAKRAATNHYQAGRAAYKTYGKGEIVLVLEANEYCDLRAMTVAVQQFNQRADCQAVLPRRNLAPGRSVASLIQVYRSLIQNRSYKASTEGQVQPMLTDRGAVYIRAEQFTMRQTNLVSMIYVAESVINVEPDNSLRHLAKQVWQAATTLRLPRTRPKHTQHVRRSLTVFCVLTLPMLITYCLYLAISLHQVVLLLACGLVTTVLLVLAICDDHQLNLSQKLMYVLGIPLTYSFFYIFTVVRAVALLRHGADHA